ncbi:BTB/POZ domain [Popillia japonica]|uniref:BTB/POZ domain n=1 Tax=Popillia japonica TaxID=7064 RepID=A0AAW1N3L6_POPJA
MAQTELLKLQQHLKLLKEEYALIQNRYNDLEAKYQNLSALAPDENEEDTFTSGLIQNRYNDLEAKYQNLSALAPDENEEDTFTSRLLALIRNLYSSETYSDIKIKLKDKEINCHKIILNARSNEWNEAFLSNKAVLNWEGVESEVGEKIIYWLYTNEINLKSDDLTLKVLVQAHDFQLVNLVRKCEEVLTKNVTVTNCVMFYSVAEQIGAVKLREFCSEVISIYWNELKPKDFEHMSGALLTKMLKEKTKLPLHSAVRLLREDVIFLLLKEKTKLPLHSAVRLLREDVIFLLLIENASKVSWRLYLNMLLQFYLSLSERSNVI